MCLGDFKQMLRNCNLHMRAASSTVKVPYLHRTGFLRACIYV